MTRKLLLWALIAVPICYYFGLIVGAATYPGYSHITRYASELGAAGAPYPALFNVSIMIGGALAVLASIGLAIALHDQVTAAAGYGPFWLESLWPAGAPPW